MTQRAFAQALSSIGREPGSAISSDPVDGAGATDEAKCDGDLELLSSQTLSGRPSHSVTRNAAKFQKLRQATSSSAIDLASEDELSRPKKRKLSQAEKDQKRKGSEKRKLSREKYEKTEKRTDREKTEKRKVSRRLHDGSFGRKSQRSKLRTTPVGQQQQSQEKRTFRWASEQDKARNNRKR